MLCDAVLFVHYFSAAIVCFACVSCVFPLRCCRFFQNSLGVALLGPMRILLALPSALSFLDIIQIRDYYICDVYFGYILGAVCISQYIMAITPVTYAPVFFTPR